MITSRPSSIYGSIQVSSDISVTKINRKWYPIICGCMFDAGFTNIQCMNNFLSILDQHEESFNMLGYYRENNQYINHLDGRSTSVLSILDDGQFELESQLYDSDSNEWKEDKLVSDNIDEIEEHMIDVLDYLKIDIFDSIIISSREDVKHVIEAKMSSRDLSKNLVRVKSSNLWSYGINIRDRKDKKGDVIVQFKGKNGGPGDLYMYLDVPVNVWRKWLAAPSKGNFLWRFIRNEYKYRKLTGDKRGKLPNAIN